MTLVSKQVINFEKDVRLMCLGKLFSSAANFDLSDKYFKAQAPQTEPSCSRMQELSSMKHSNRYGAF